MGGQPLNLTLEENPLNNTPPTPSPGESGSEGIFPDEVEKLPKAPMETAAAKKRSSPQGFDEWWQAYPRKDGEFGAQRAYAKALKSGATPAELLAGAKRYADERAREPNSHKRWKFSKSPENWLSGGHWADEAVPPEEDGICKWLKEINKIEAERAAEMELKRGLTSFNGNPLDLSAKGQRPDKQDQEAGKELGSPNSVLLEEWEKFKDHYISHGNRMADWSAAWRKWLGNAKEYRQRPQRSTQLVGAI